MIKIKSDKIIINDTLFDGYLYIDNRLISSVSTENLDADEFYDYTGKFVSAGFIEMHTHGGGGNAFITDNKDSVIKGCDFHLAHGTTSIMPTVSTDDISVMVKAVDCIKKAKLSGETKANVLGAHLEGPYLSKKQSGAQAGGHIKTPDATEYQAIFEKYGDIIARWTYAPEVDKDQKFAKYISSKGVILSAGHSDAKYEDMKKAVENGCNLITHLYSCTSTITRNKGFRSLGVIESAYLMDELFVEIIADGKHLPPELIKMIVKIKGADKVCLVTDSLEIAGSNVLSGVMSGVEFEVSDGVCKLKDGTGFAGSIATADMLLKTLIFECGYSVPFAVKMITKTPASLLKLNKGELKAGFDADIVVFDDKINVSNVFVGGEKVI